MLESESAFLFELRGQNPGRAQGLTGDVFRIGCDTENDLILREDGIALYQAEIRLEGRQFLIRNLSIKGAIFLNGEPFDEAVLGKGDILTIGDSTYRFVMPGEALTQEDLWQPVGGHGGLVSPGFMLSKRVVLLLGLCLLAAGAAFWAVTVRGPQSVSPPVSETERDRDTARPMHPGVLAALYYRGVDLMSTRHWDQALVILEQVRNESPHYLDVDRLYKEGLLESQAAQHFAQARGYVTEGALLLAAQALRQIPDGSVLYREADRMLREIDREVLAARLDRVQTFMADGDWLSARGEVTAILEDEPRNEDALSLRRQIDRLEATPGAKWHFVRRPDVSLPGTGGSPFVGRVVDPEPRAPPGGPAVDPAPAAQPPETVAAVTRPPRRAAPPPSPLERARSAYLRGDADGALDELRGMLEWGVEEDAARAARRMQSDVLTAKNWFHQAETLQKQGRSAEALEIWERFLQKDREVAGKAESALFRRASAQLSRIYYARGREAFDADDVINAARFWRMGSRVAPDNPDLKRGMGQLAELGRRYYREGYTLQEINPSAAVERFMVVLEIFPPGHPDHERAKARIERSTAMP